MKRKLLGLIGLTGAALFAAGYATTVCLSERKEVKESWDEEDQDEEDEEDDGFWGEDETTIQNSFPSVPICFGNLQEINIPLLYEWHGINFGYRLQRFNEEEALFARISDFRPKCYEQEGELIHFSCGRITDQKQGVSLEKMEEVFNWIMKNCDLEPGNDLDEITFSYLIFADENSTKKLYFKTPKDNEELLDIFRELSESFDEKKGYTLQEDVPSNPFKDLDDQDPVKPHKPVKEDAQEKPKKKASPRKKKEETSMQEDIPSEE